MVVIYLRFTFLRVSLTSKYSRISCQERIVECVQVCSETQVYQKKKKNTDVAIYSLAQVQFDKVKRLNFTHLDTK